MAQKPSPGPAVDTYIPLPHPVTDGETGHMSIPWSLWTQRVNRTVVNLGAITDIMAEDSPYTVLPTDNLITVDASGGAVTVQLPQAVQGNRGRPITVKKIDASVNTVTVLPNGTDTIDGAASLVETIQNESRNLISAIGNWWVT